MSETNTDTTEYRLHEKDTGGAAVQAALLTERIKHLTEHLGRNPKDVSSRRGLLKMVSRRRKLMTYLKNTDADRHEKVRSGLGLRK
jgi:small subunit ribosomal protein S15